MAEYEFELICKCGNRFRVRVPHFEYLEEVECPSCGGDIFDVTEIGSTDR